MRGTRRQANDDRVAVRCCAGLLVLAVAALIGGGCGVFGTPADTPEQVARRWYNVFATEGPSGALNMLSNDVVWILPDSPMDAQGNPEIEWLGRREGRAEVQEFFNLLGQQVQMQEFTPQQFYPVGNTVLVVLHERSVCIATQIPYTLDFVHRLEISNNQITLVQNYLNIGPIVAAFRGDNSFNQGLASETPDPAQVLMEYGLAGFGGS